MTWFLSFFWALVTGTVSAWGVGGGTLLLLVMTLFLGVDQRTAQAINLLFFLPTAGAALLLHRRNGHIDTETCVQVVPLGVLFALIGAWISTTVEISALRRPFGVFLLVAGGSILWQSVRKKSPPS